MGRNKIHSERSHFKRQHSLTLQVMSVTLVQPWNSTSEPFFLTCAHSLTQ